MHNGDLRDPVAKCYDVCATLDARKYEDCWNNAGQTLKASIPWEQWLSAVRESRGGLGDVTTRDTEQIVYSRQLSDKPSGDYVVVTTRATFARGRADEIVSVEKEQASWKLIGYFIQKR
jgi:hypothetical protein